MIGAIATSLLPIVATGQLTIPPEWEVAVINPCESASEFSPIPYSAYVKCRLATTNTVRHQGHSVVWTFVPKPGTTAVGLSHPAEAFQGRGAVSLWVKNPEGYPLRLRLRVIRNDGKAYGSESLPIDDARAWRALVFLTDRFRPLEETAREEYLFALPLARIEIMLEGVTAGREYTLYLDDLTAYLAPPETVEVTAITAPEQAQTGQTVTAQVHLKVPAELHREYAFALCLTRDGVAVSQAALQFAQPPTEWPTGVQLTSEPVSLEIPRFVSGGEYIFRVRAPGLALSGEAAIGVPIVVSSAAGEAPVMTLQEREGGPTVLLGDHPISLWGYFWEGSALGDETGPVLIVPATAAHDPYGHASDVWLAREVWDYEGVDEKAIGALRAHPNAWLILRVFVEAPDWWDAENPQELMLFSHGRHAVKIPGLEGKRTFAAFSSRKWRTDAAEALRRFVTHVEQSPYADRVIGYVVAGGEDGRWRYWGAAEGLYADYSRPQRLAFIAWLRAKNNNDLRALRARWQEVINPVLTPPEGEKPIPTLLSWDDVRIPTAAARTSHPSQSLLDPAAAPEVADYNTFHAEVAAEFICELAATIKGACARRKLVGVSYGHFLDHVFNPELLPNAGHAALDRVLTSSDIDLVAAPPISKKAPNGFFAASLKAHHKLPITEVLPSDTDVDLELEAARIAAVGGAIWINGSSLPANWRQLANTAGQGDRTSVAEIALVIDHVSLAYLAEGNDLSLPLLADQCASLARIGAPFDVWLLDDLIAGRMPDYKLYVMPNAFYLDRRAREAVLQQVAHSGKVVVWVYAAGALDETLSGTTALELTGLAVGSVGRSAPLRVKLSEAPHPLLEGAPPGLTYGPTHPIGPVFFAMPTRGEVLGTIRVPSLLDKGEPREWAGLIASEGERWTSIYSAAPNVPPEVLRPIAKRAGVHLYLEANDEVFGSASFLAIHALATGDKRVSLPRPADVRDLRSQALIATKASEFAVTMTAGETRAFVVSPVK